MELTRKDGANDSSRSESGGVVMMQKAPQQQILTGNWQATWAIARLDADVVAVES